MIESSSLQVRDDWKLLYIYTAECTLYMYTGMRYSLHMQLFV